MFAPLFFYDIYTSKFLIWVILTQKKKKQEN